MSKKVKPKQYTHIDYEALLIYVMKNHTSVVQAIEDLEIDIARSTIVRNINKLKKENSSIVNLYQNFYICNMQKKQLPEELQYKINSLEERKIVDKNELEDLYQKLLYMKKIVEQCDGNVAMAARTISNGTTILGDIKITTQGLQKNLKRYEIVEKEYKKQGNINKEQKEDEQK